MEKPSFTAPSTVGFFRPGRVLPLLLSGLWLACTPGSKDAGSPGGAGGVGGAGGSGGAVDAGRKDGAAGDAGTSETNPGAGGNSAAGGAGGMTTPADAGPDLAGGVGGSAGTGGTSSPGVGGAGGMGVSGLDASTGMPDVAPPTGTTPMFVAIGHGGRRLTSCDDGRTWIAEQKVNDEDLDHSDWSGQGLAYGSGVFVAVYGWFGSPGGSAQILRSEDGVTWTQTLGQDKKGDFANAMSYGNTTFVANVQRSRAHLSTDLGLTWTTVAFGAPDAAILRGGIFIPFGPGRFFAAGQPRIAYSDDNGKDWTESSTPCPYFRETSLAYGNGVFLSASQGGVCRSLDGGKTWTQIDNPSNSFNGRLIWTGQDFYITSLAEGYRSPDGIAWTRVPHQRAANTPWVSDIAISDKGTFVGVDQTGDTFFRSTDGASWTVAVRGEAGPTTLAGTRITHLVFGTAKASARCPARP